MTLNLYLNLYLKDSYKSLPKQLILLNKFGNILGYKVNLGKSEIMPQTHFDHSKLQLTNPFKWVPTVDSNLKKLYKLNYISLLNKIEADLQRRMNLPLTLLGRINCIKLNIQPKLHRFQTLPILLSQSLFKVLTGYVRQFIWKGKAP